MIAGRSASRVTWLRKSRFDGERMPVALEAFSIPNPLRQREPELAERLAVFEAQFTDILLDKLAATTLQSPALCRELCPHPLADVKANSLIFRVLAKDMWDAYDLRIFDAYWRDANLSPLYGSRSSNDSYDRRNATRGLSQINSTLFPSLEPARKPGNTGFPSRSCCQTAKARRSATAASKLA